MLYLPKVNHGLSNISLLYTLGRSFGTILNSSQSSYNKLDLKTFPMHKSTTLYMNKLINRFSLKLMTLEIRNDL